MGYKEFSYMHCYIHAALTFLTINLQRPLQIIHCDKYYEGKVRDALKLYKKCPIQIREEEGTGAMVMQDSGMIKEDRVFKKFCRH